MNVLFWILIVLLCITSIITKKNKYRIKEYQIKWILHPSFVYKVSVLITFIIGILFLISTIYSLIYLKSSFFFNEKFSYNLFFIVFCIINSLNHFKEVHITDEGIVKKNYINKIDQIYKWDKIIDVTFIDKKRIKFKIKTKMGNINLVCANKVDREEIYSFFDKIYNFKTNDSVDLATYYI